MLLAVLQSVAQRYFKKLVGWGDQYLSDASISYFKYFASSNGIVVVKKRATIGTQQEVSINSQKVHLLAMTQRLVPIGCVTSIPENMSNLMPPCLTGTNDNRNRWPSAKLKAKYSLETHWEILNDLVKSFWV